MVTIVDLGLGNVNAFFHAFQVIGVEAKIASSADPIINSSRLILPGVGSFDHVLEMLRCSGMEEPLHRAVFEQGKPILGVCSGMQIMGFHSEEGKGNGLGWIPGHVSQLPKENIEKGFAIPHIGWNEVSEIGGSNSAKLFKGIEIGSFYFLHSYFYNPENPQYAIGWTEYGMRFCSAINKDNIFGVQFHPEKSHSWGMQLLKNFAEI